MTSCRGFESQEVAVLSHSRVDPAVVFTSLAEIARDASTPKDLYAAICVAATLTVPGCDHASLMIRRDGVYNTAEFRQTGPQAGGGRRWRAAFSLRHRCAAL